MSASLLAMPMLIINMGGEMLYILEQRLQAQNIATDKSAKVLQDVVSTMYSPKFITELFKPQRIYTQSSTRQIFDRLAHSSIMRLNSSSMGKLYDLMTMGFKYQVMSCKHAPELLQVSLNHLDSLRAMLPSSSNCVALVNRAAKLFMSTYGGYTVGQWVLLRHTLCRFFQDRRVKVSLFLQDSIQSPDGMVVVTHSGALPVGAEVPGLIKYYANGRVSSQETVSLANASGVTASVPVGDITQPTRPCELGLNMYGADRKRQGAVDVAPPKVMQPADTFQPSETDQKAAKAELNMLASLIGGSSGSTARVNVNLFPQQLDISGDSKAPSSEIICFDATDRSAMVDRYGNFGNLDIPDTQGGDNDEEDDLLALMDGL